ncbi:HAMP domain-containing protein [Streptomyces sp. J2-1]|uniref:sensor histidine kinase n=1 Tax=Streptomyces corallincola TaxID=2851888 RepID=UPI001C386309|nr:HAMP domain-containing histidine kinase [Streptomyces corallincola]MBV2354245.1 HAMP domain-containing protein [Streptomyces corallincola]
MSTTQVDAPDRHAQEHGGATSFADRWPFRRKLNLLVGIPIAVVAVLLSYLVNDLVRQSSEAARAAGAVRDSAQVARLVDRVEAEHQQAILLSVRYESGDARPSLTAYRTAQRAVDTQVRQVRATYGDGLPDAEAQTLRDIEGLSSLRESVEASYLPADNIDPAYVDAADRLIDGLGLDRDASLADTFTGNLLDSLLRADAAHGAFETSVFSATTRDTNALIEFTHAVGSYDLYTHQADRFTRFATEGQARQLAGIDHTEAQQQIARAYADLQIDPAQLDAGSRESIRLAVRDALADYPDYREQAAARLKITTALIDQIADRADAASGSAQWRAGFLLYGALIGFVLWIALAVLVRRSVIRPVQALTGAAREVAEVAGRELDRVADDDAEDAAPPRLRDVPVTARDEIGDLAEAFNRVQTTASALLERQVLSRRNTAEMFGNVGRRVSNLTSRQLTLIDSVERGETDPALLERLYSIDHIAVRLRRNADSLMLLAGIRETALDGGPSTLSHVVRAALGQIEGYRRVRLYAASDAVIAPDVIGDLTLMTAELVENAVSFSPHGSPVEVTVGHGPDGAHVVVTDHGLGMSAERLAEENARLVRRERLDLVPTKVLGLFVVGALARRWQLRVQLTRTPGGGVTAEVTLPDSLLLRTSAPADRGAGEAAVPVGVGPADTGGPSGPVPARTAEEARPPLPAQRRAEPEPEPAHGEHPAPAPEPAHDHERAQSGTEASGAGDDTSLPRRLPRRRADSDPAPGHDPVPATAGEPPAPAGSTLRRRVRGATLRTTAGTAEAAPQAAARPRDADAERDALEEFEAAVRRANLDTGAFHLPARPEVPEGMGSPEAPTASGVSGVPRRTTPPHDQNHLPEGAES